MGAHLAGRFGEQEFSISVDDVLAVDSSQAHLASGVVTLRGLDWSLGGEVTETLVQLSTRLTDFASDGELRHFGAFAGVDTPAAAVTHVEEHAFGTTTDSRRHGIGGAWASSALARYSLSALFDHNLSVRQAISVRTPRHEHLMWTDLDSVTHHVTIPSDTFDEAVREFHRWSCALAGNA